MDQPLLEWLDSVTFPTESKFKDPSFAQDVYEKAVWRHLTNGTTTCVYFASIHLEATKILARASMSVGQRAFIGKVSLCSLPASL